MHRALALSTLLFVVTASRSAAGEPGKEDEKAVSIANSAWNVPLVGFGGKTNDAYTDGHVFMTLPIWSTIGRNGRLGGDYVIIEPYTSLGEQGEVATSLGVSWRHLFNDEPVSALEKKGQAGIMEEGFYIGASLFVDMLDTQNDNRFWQLGFGAEIGTRYLELRGNYYLPLTDRELVERQVSTQTFATQSSSTRYYTEGTGGGSGGVPFAAGNQILQDYGSLTTYATTTTRTQTTTVRTVTELYEEGMEGWDAEAAVLVPGIDRYMDVRLLAGYFSFDNQPFGPQSLGTGNVRGWKAGIEVRPVPAVLLTAMWYEDERFTGSDWTLGVQFQIPLGADWKEAFRPRRRHLVERLAEPVRRQNDAIKVGNDVDQQQETSTSSSVARVTRVVSQSPGRIVLMDDVIFVNNGADAGNGIKEGAKAGADGTAEHPVLEVSEGADIAAANRASTGRVWNVYTQGDGVGEYTADVEVTASTRFLSSATIITAPDGQTFGTGVRPLLRGTIKVSDVGVFGLRDYDISASKEGAALDLENVGQAVITNNNIANDQERVIDIGVTSGTSRIELSNNTLRDASNVGLDLFTNGAGSTLNLTFNGNAINNISVEGVSASRLGGSTMTINGTVNNTVTVGGAVYDQSGAPTGNIILNGVNVSVSVDH